MYMYDQHLYTWCTWKPEQASDALGLELKKVVSHHVTAGDPVIVLWKSYQCSQLLGHLSLRIHA